MRLIQISGAKAKLKTIHNDVSDGLAANRPVTMPSGAKRSVAGKPKLIFFQYEYKGLAPFLLLHQREHVDCLSLFFDVTVIRKDCDYAEVCDRYEPDLVMFESGVPFHTCRRPAITNLNYCSRIPKLGFLHADGFGEGRSGFFSDMDHWGIETFFAIATTAVEHTPALSGRVFVWPNFVNPDLYRDYGQAKTIDVLFTGNKNNLYPWRQKMVDLIPKYYRSVVSSHPGYIPQNDSGSFVVGESYARMLNRSLVVPACGSVAKEIIRKHFEVPACRSCLISERSVALEAAGFEDMKNCIFADENDILSKLGYVLEHREELAAIIDAGHQLVHSRHTIRHRDQVWQWFTLNSSLKAGQAIVQKNPFEPLEVVDVKTERDSDYIRCNGELVSSLRKAEAFLQDGAVDAAEQRYQECVTYYRFMPEPLLGLTICKLLQGDPQRAMTYILQPLEATLADYDAVDPDPVEWAYFLVTLLCLGKVHSALRRSREFPWLSHPELDRILSIINALKSGNPAAWDSCKAKSSRLTVHQLPLRSAQQWLQQLLCMLRSCGQAELALKVLRLTSRIPATQSDEADGYFNNCGQPVQEADLRRNLWRNRRFVYLRTDAYGFFKRRRLYSFLFIKSKAAVKTSVRAAEAAISVFFRSGKQSLSPTLRDGSSEPSYCERRA